MPFLDIFSSKKEKPKEKPKVTIDIHEKNSLVPTELHNLGCEIGFKPLKVGDYIINQTIIERKTTQDFISSMINQRLYNQIKNLQQSRSKLIIIEGELESLFYNDTNIHENSVRGFILSILLNHQIPIIFTQTPRETAKYLTILAKKQKPTESSLHSRIPKNQKEQISYILQSFPGIGPKTAKKLIQEFKTLKNIFNTPEEKIENLIGKKSDAFKILDKQQD